MKQNSNKNGQNLSAAHRGFTIVELLIVVVIIAILAAITIVAYNGIQARANNSAALATANSLAKKAHAFATINGTYPTATTVATLKGATQLGKYSESTLPTSGINIHTTAAPMTAANGTNTVKVSVCTSGGMIITPWDYLKTPTPGDSLSPITVGDTTSGCTLITT